MNMEHINRRTALQQLLERLSWVVAMIILGSCNIIIDILNALYFSDSDLSRCLVIGPSTYILWLLQVLFTSVAVGSYICVTLNTISVFRHNSTGTLVPIHYEMLLTLPIEHIPLAAINYFTAKCRQHYATPLQRMIGAFQMIFILIRLVWYAHIEGKKLKKNDKYKIQRVFFMVICVLFSCALVFPFMIWREQNNLRLEKHHLKNVSIYFLNLPNSMVSEILLDKKVDDLLMMQGYNTSHPYLVPSLLAINESQVYGYNATYNCQNNTDILPQECTIWSSNHTPSQLIFRFKFSESSPACAMGEIRYNYALTYFWNSTCVPSSGNIHPDWKLSYFYTQQQKHGDTIHVNLTSPWLGTCVTPVPTYDPSINICSH